MKNDCSYVLPIFSIKSRVIRTVNTLNNITDNDLNHLFILLCLFFHPGEYITRTVRAWKNVPASTALDASIVFSTKNFILSNLFENFFED